MVELMLAAIGADTDAKSKVMQIVIETDAMKQRMLAKNSLLEDHERGILTHFASVLGEHLAVNPEDKAATKIQACWRGYKYVVRYLTPDRCQVVQHAALYQVSKYLTLQVLCMCVRACYLLNRWRKSGYQAFKQVYSPPMINAFRDLVRTEGTFLQTVTDINETYIRPILNTPDKQLREQSQDLTDPFVSLKSIEALHRYEHTQSPFASLSSSLLFSLSLSLSVCLSVL
jgi:hypothetical protein